MKITTENELPKMNEIYSSFSEVEKYVFNRATIYN